MAESKRRFHRTLIQVEVLSEEPYNPESLAEVANDIVQGDCSGKWDVKLQTEVTGRTMAKLLQDQGSDPEFFMLTEDGEDTE